MKLIKQTLIASITFLAIFSCTKQKINIATDHPPTPSLPQNPPLVFAGPDMSLELPINSTTISGSYTDPTNDIRKKEWRKISGPDSCIIETKDSLSTRISGLKLGVYQFELSITNGFGLTGKDSVIVVVWDNSHFIQGPVGTNEVTFTNIKWVYPWYSSLEIKNVYNSIPRNKPIKVFVKRDSTNNWIEVLHWSINTITDIYDYFIESRWPDGAGMYSYGSLYISYYGPDTKDTPDVKIQY
ncbi:MAG: hypothetical protein JST17_04565 [Bacteroidetes bacterium]|nr:hypothetical protein [Bacteroidota bacterium]MBS1929682.1 hypothetical protein [Bacteroidota bacterium]